MSQQFPQSAKNIVKGITTPLSLIALFMILDAGLLFHLLPIKVDECESISRDAVITFLVVFCVLVLLLSILIIFKIENLMFDKEALMRWRGILPPYGESDKPVTRVSRRNQARGTENG